MLLRDNFEGIESVRCSYTHKLSSEGSEIMVSPEIAGAVQATVAQLREMSIRSAKADWDAAVNSTTENLQAAADARAAEMHALADPNEYARYRDWDNAQVAADDPLLARQIRILHYTFARNQND